MSILLRYVRAFLVPIHILGICLLCFSPPKTIFIWLTFHSQFSVRFMTPGWMFLGPFISFWVCNVSLSISTSLFVVLVCASVKELVGSVQSFCYRNCVFMLSLGNSAASIRENHTDFVQSTLIMKFILTSLLLAFLPCCLLRTGIQFGYLYKFLRVVESVSVSSGQVFKLEVKRKDSEFSLKNWDWGGEECTQQSLYSNVLYQPDSVSHSFDVSGISLL